MIRYCENNFFVIRPVSAAKPSLVFMPEFEEVKKVAEADQIISLCGIGVSFTLLIKIYFSRIDEKKVTCFCTQVILASSLSHCLWIPTVWYIFDQITI